MYSSNEQVARKVFRSFKTASDNDRKSDPILAFHFRGKNDFILMRCNKEAEITIKGKDQPAGEVKFFAYSEFSDYDEEDVILKLKDQIDIIELYRRGAIEALTWKSWGEFTKWLDALDENGVQISLKLPCLVYRAVKDQKPSMQNFIVEAIKKSLKAAEG